MGERPAARGRLRSAVAGYLLAVLASSVAAAAVGSAAGDPESIVVLLAAQLGFWAVLVATVVYAANGRGSQAALGGLRLELRWTDLPAGAAVGVAAQLIVVPALYLPLRGFIDEDELARSARELLDRAQGPALVLMGLAVIVVAPIVEELFFRGLLLGALRDRWGSGVGVVGSSLVFGATHFQPVQFVALVVAGAIFATAAVRTGRLGPAVAVHAGFNATTFAALALTG